eukprot:scaffold6808_cov106-Isochrysis_galbana.AAC.4
MWAESVVGSSTQYVACGVQHGVGDGGAVAPQPACHAQSEHAGPHVEKGLPHAPKKKIPALRTRAAVAPTCENEE